MNKLNEQESSEKKIKSIPLKFVVQKKEISKDESEGFSDSKKISLLTKKFCKFLKKRGKYKTQPQILYGYIKPKACSSSFTCFRYDKQEHIIIECPK